MKDWEKELLRRAREIFKNGEGELTFKVRNCYNESDKIEWIITGGDTARGKIPLTNN